MFRQSPVSGGIAGNILSALYRLTIVVFTGNSVIMDSTAIAIVAGSELST